MSFGLSGNDIEVIRSVLAGFPGVEEARIFGSRSLGSATNGSDVDLAVFTRTSDSGTADGIRYVLEEETLLPYRFDVVDYGRISRPGLKDHIDRIGKTLYRRSGGPK